MDSETKEIRSFYSEYKHNLLLMFNDTNRYPINKMTNDHILRFHLVLERDLAHFIENQKDFIQFESRKDLKETFCPLIRAFKLHRKLNKVMIGKLDVKINSYNRLHRLVDQLNAKVLLKQKF